MKQLKKEKGIFFTTNKDMLSILCENLLLDKNILQKNILEPSCGNGFIILFLLNELSKLFHKNQIQEFIENNLYFNDILIEHTKETILNIQNWFQKTYSTDIKLNIKNVYNIDFTLKNNSLFKQNFDYIIGNPPYVSLYGRRGIKKSEELRLYYLKNFKQFPKHLQNGKLNYIMFFLENGMELLNKNGFLSYIIDISFFEPAYKYTREFLYKNYKLLEIDFNFSHFEGVASGQIILKIQNKKENYNYDIKLVDYQNKHSYIKDKHSLFDIENSYNINLNKMDELEQLTLNIKENFFKIENYFDKKSKFIRTGTMMLNFEKEFIIQNEIENIDIPYFLYFKGSKSLKYKYDNLIPMGYFLYDTKKRDYINEKLKLELEKEGIKNKKRIGFGELEVFDNPKLFIRQSASQIVSSINLQKSTCNNSLYILSFRDNSTDSIQKLHFFNAWLNSTFISFFALKTRIIKISKGKQPQIRISDLYKLPLIYNKNIIEVLSKISTDIYKTTNKEKKEKLMKEIDNIIFDLFKINNNQKEKIIKFNQYYL